MIFCNLLHFSFLCIYFYFVDRNDKIGTLDPGPEKPDLSLKEKAKEELFSKELGVLSGQLKAFPIAWTSFKALFI
jgi:hypothetical protein